MAPAGVRPCKKTTNRLLVDLVDLHLDVDELLVDRVAS
jgi:hypothetical protein